MEVTFIRICSRNAAFIFHFDHGGNEPYSITPNKGHAKMIARKGYCISFCLEIFRASKNDEQLTKSPSVISKQF